MVCHSQELMKEEFIKELLEDNPSELNLKKNMNQKILEKEVKLIDVVLLLIEQDMLCYTLFSEDHWDSIAISSLNILSLT